MKIVLSFGVGNFLFYTHIRAYLFILCVYVCGCKYHTVLQLAGVGSQGLSSGIQGWQRVPVYTH